MARRKLPNTVQTTPVRASLLRWLILALAVTATAGCTAPWRGRVVVTVMAPWVMGTAEGDSFRKLVEDYAAKQGFTVRYTGVRDVVSVLPVEVAKGTQPDIVIMSSPASLIRYAKRTTTGAAALRPLDLGPDVEPGQLIVGASGRPYGVIVKTDLKSMVWHPSDTPLPTPTTWNDLVTASAALRAGGTVTPWCIGVEDGSEPGWPGTDWIEDILLHQSGVAAYQAWTTGALAWTDPKVVAAWTAWGDLLRASGMNDLATARAILTQTWQQAHTAMTSPPPGGRRCGLEHQASFVAPAKGSQTIGYELFPRLDQGTGDDPSAPEASGAVEVSVDVAGGFGSGRETRDLLRYLASRRGQEDRVKASHGIFFSPRNDVSRGLYGPTGLHRRIADDLANTPLRCRDGSNSMPQAVSDAFSRAVLEFLANPEPDRLPGILDRVERVRKAVDPSEWLTYPCS